MKIRIERKGKVIESDYLKIELSDDILFKISEERGELVITKINFDDTQIRISPCVSNQIKIK